jgi:hypothetical protein
MIETTSALPFPYLENLAVTRIHEEVNIIGQTIGERPGDGFRLREGGH